MKFFIVLLLLLSNKAFSVVGHDDRFYIHGTKWGKLLNGIMNVNNSCTGFVLEGDVIVTVAHCFKQDIDYNEDGIIDAYSPIAKDAKIDYKKLKKVEVRFGDANFDALDESKKTHFDKRSQIYRIKELFLAHNPRKTHNSILDETAFKDYTFIKLKKSIPKNIRRFKIFHSDLLKDYDILKHSYKGNLSTAGYHGDNTKIEYQRLAHIGCKVRDMKQYKKVWLEYSDCDIIHGASGSPLFYILKHKKTKKIELAVSSIFIKSNAEHRRRDVDYKTYKNDEGELIRKDTDTRYRLAFSDHYFINAGFYHGSAAKSLLVTNHKEFLTNLEKFKKDSSFFKNKKLIELEKTKYLDKNWIYKNIIQKKSLKKLKNFIYKDLTKLSLKYISNPATDQIIEEISKDTNFKIKKEKREFLNQVFDENSKNSYWNIKYKYFDQFYPYKKRSKKFSEKKIGELIYKHINEGIKDFPYEDSVDDKKKAKKLWKMYFSK